MHPGPDSMGAPSGLTARRPNASSLPNFELPAPPPFSGVQKYPAFASGNVHSPATGNTGSLLTPPSNVSDSMSSNAQSSQNMSYNPNSYVWSPPAQGSAPYGFQPHAPATSQSYAIPRALPPPPYDLNHPPSFPSSAPMSAPSGQQSAMPSMMNSQHSVPSSAPHQSPVHPQESYPTRLPPTPTYHHYNSQASTTPQQSTFSYSTGPSPTQPSPLSGGGMHRMSPAHSAAQVPSMQSAHSPLPFHQRHYQNYPLPGPVLSNVHNPSGQLALVGGMPHGGMVPAYPNSGHAASMSHMYGQPHPGAHPAPPNDRPFKCDQCPQSFNRNHDLKRHKRIHLAVKPFPCGHCDKSFSRKDALKRHILVKGCGKAAAAAADADKHDGSVSPTDKASMISDASEQHKAIHPGR